MRDADRVGGGGATVFEGTWDITGSGRGGEEEKAMQYNFRSVWNRTWVASPPARHGKAKLTTAVPGIKITNIYLCSEKNGIL